MRFKKILSAALAAVLAVQASALTSFADVDVNSDKTPVLDGTSADEAVRSENEADEVLYTAEFSLEADEFNTEEAEKRYFHQLMYADLDNQCVGLYNSAYSVNTLTKSQKAIYDTIFPELKLIAEGQRDNDGIEIIPEAEYNSVNEFNTDLSKALTCLMRNYPEYFYWFGRSWGMSYNMSFTRFSVSFSVSASYASADDSKKIDKAKINKAQTAINNAKTFAKSCEELLDYQKIYAFCDKICELNSYNYDAADLSGQVANYPATDCNPWEIVSVFDNDPSTNVVCEGYSKAMQYLCDLSGIECYIATSSDHMWNIVSLDGTSYHVDVTFADTGTGDNLSLVKDNHPYVLKGASYSDGERVEIYTKIPGYVGMNTTYEYEAKTIDLLPESIRKVSTEDYDIKAASSCGKIAGLASSAKAKSIKLTWDKYASASYYNVSILKDGKWTQLTKTENNATLSYTATGLSENTQYKFRVTAYNSSGTTIAYSEITVKTECGTISNLAAAPTNSSIKLTWGKYAAGSYYKVWVKQDGAWKLLKKTANNTTLAYTESGLKANTSYTFRVGAFNANGTMIANTDITAKTKAKVASLKSTVTNSSVKLTWSKYASGSYYKIWVKQNGSWKLLKKTANNTTLAYTASSLKANTSYTFRVGAFNASGTMTAYTDITAKTKAKVASLKSTVTNSSVKLTWNKYASGSYYKVWVKQDGAWKLLKQTKNNTTLTYTASGLKANTSYTFRVGAFNASGTMVAYTDITAKTKGKVAGVSAITTSSSIKLTWSKYAAASYYKIWVDKDGKWTALVQTNNNTTLACTVNKLKSGTSYKYRIGAFNASGTMIAYTDITAKTK